MIDLVIGEEIQHYVSDDNWDDMFRPDNYYVVRDIRSGKYADGYFGWDGNIHSEEQIFSGDDIPYKKSAFTETGMQAICVGKGRRPKTQNVCDYLNARGL